MEAFTAEFMAAAQKVFEMIDKDGSGSLAIDEITRAVKEEQEVIDFLENCGGRTSNFYVRPKRLKKAPRGARHGQVGGSRRGGVVRRAAGPRRGFNLRRHRHGTEAHRSPRAGTKRSTGASLLD